MHKYKCTHTSFTNTNATLKSSYIVRVKASKPTVLRDLEQNTTSLPRTHCTRPALIKKNLSTIHPMQIHASSFGDARQPSNRITKPVVRSK